MDVYINRLPEVRGVLHREPRPDVITFTAGIARTICSSASRAGRGLALFGVKIDVEANSGCPRAACVISAPTDGDNLRLPDQRGAGKFARLDSPDSAITRPGFPRGLIQGVSVA